MVCKGWLKITILDNPAWSYLRLPDVYYLVVDLPCQSETFTRWNYRPCSVVHPFDLNLEPVDPVHNSNIKIALPYHC